MKTVVLIRQFNSHEGVPGWVYVKNEESGQMEYFSRSLELPWINNESRISCIPVGSYDCEVTYSPKYRRDMYMVKAVPGRSGIRLHSASFAGDVRRGLKCHLLGCIALGKGFYGGPGTVNQLLLHTSRVTMKKFRELTEDRPFRLIIAGDLLCL